MTRAALGWILVSAACAGAFGGCAGGTIGTGLPGSSYSGSMNPDAKFASITIYVVDASGAPVPDGEVELSSSVEATPAILDASGSANVMLRVAPGDSLSVSVRRGDTRYSGTVGKLPPGRGGPANLKIKLGKGESLTGSYR